MRDKRSMTFLAVIGLAGLLNASPALAYVGPGLGAGAVAVVLAVLGSVVVAILGVVYYPIKRMLKARKKRGQPGELGRNIE